MQKVKKQPLKLDHIGINRIIFDDSEYVTLWGFRLKEGRKIQTSYITDFNLLNKLLRLSGKEGDELQMLLVEEIENGIKEPSVIDIESKLGQAAFFNHCILEVSPTWFEDEKGNWKKDKECLSIDAVYPLLEKREKTLSAQTILRRSLIECEEQLAQAYELYLGYLELDMDEAFSLKMSGLEDDLKFKMAYYAWKMNQKAA